MPLNISSKTKIFTTVQMQEKFTYCNLHLKLTSWLSSVALIKLKAFIYPRRVLLNFTFFAQDAIAPKNAIALHPTLRT